MIAHGRHACAAITARWTRQPQPTSTHPTEGGSEAGAAPLRRQGRERHQAALEKVADTSEDT